MIKAVDEIPTVAKIEKITRAGSVREDIFNALAFHISRFAFVGEIYTTCGGRYSADLNKTVVDDIAWTCILRFIKQQIVELGYDKKYFRFADYNINSTYKVYSYQPPDGTTRVYMEINFDAIDFIIAKYIERFCGGRKYK